MPGKSGQQSPPSPVPISVGSQHLQFHSHHCNGDAGDGFDDTDDQSSGSIWRLSRRTEIVILKAATDKIISFSDAFADAADAADISGEEPGASAVYEEAPLQLDPAQLGTLHHLRRHNHRHF